MDEPNERLDPIRVLIVEDHLVVADGLVLTLSHTAGVEVVGAAGSVAESVELARETQPHVVLMDYHLPDGTGADAATAIRQHVPNVSVLILSGDPAESALLAAIEAGACGYLLKSQAATQVVAAVMRAAEGEMLIPAATLARLLGHQRRVGEQQQMIEALTRREHEVLLYMAQGMDNRSIADQLIIGYSTVRSHVQNVLDKLGAHSKLEAVARANEMGLLKQPSDRS